MPQLHNRANAQLQKRSKSVFSLLIFV